MGGCATLAHIVDRGASCQEYPALAVWWLPQPWGKGAVAEVAVVAWQSAGSAENIRSVVAEMRRAITIHPNRGFVWDSRVALLSFFTVYFLATERNDRL